MGKPAARVAGEGEGTGLATAVGLPVGEVPAVGDDLAVGLAFPPQELLQAAAAKRANRSREIRPKLTLSLRGIVPRLFMGYEKDSNASPLAQ